MSAIGDIAAYLPARHVRPLRVFLCHAAEDREDVALLYKRLRAEGFAPWMDIEDLLAGQDWKREITIAVETSDAVIVCLSPTAIAKKGYFQAERKLALQVAALQPAGTIFVVPLKIEGCELPEDLRELHAVDLTTDRSYEVLLRSLRARAESLRERFLASAWREPIALDDFTPRLVREIQRCTEALTALLVDLEDSPPRPSANREFRDRLNALVLSLIRPPEIDDGLHVDITCLDEERAYFIHPWIPNRGSTHEQVWTWSQGPEFSPWFWERIAEMERGMLTWLDDLNDDKRFLRKTIVSFNHFAVVPGVRWTAAVEGHELTRVRRKR
jgi:hypothetical protein